ncbi:MAG: metallophosphoesterase [Acidobacteria bacterium]|nr:MAG: metallophosphoesterase [Acidobacteriota bacterium]RPJ77063.1 MAG: metallophosphoesterase [Acidobacteriota bacterium]
MRYLILSDIHSNIDALEAVLAAAPAFDRLLILGDLVGYCADPNGVIARIRELRPYAVIRGNHDKVAAGLETADGFNPTAQKSADWTRDSLTEENRAYLRGLDAGPLIVDDLTEICHGSPADEDTYIFGDADAAEGLTFARRPACFFGHTHLPTAVMLSPERELQVVVQGAGDHAPFRLAPGRQYLINPGSVGQPRDGDPRAAYALLDTDARQVTLARVAYPVERAHDRILAAGLPKVLAQRLLVGR